MVRDVFPMGTKGNHGGEVFLDLILFVIVVPEQFAPFKITVSVFHLSLSCSL